MTHDRTWDDEATEAPGAPRVGGRYELLALVGQGAMGTVYKALDRELDEVVALKVIRSERAADPAMLSRLRQEVKLARRITHPNVVRIYDLGEEGDGRFVTMEYLAGGSLAEHLADRGWLPASTVREVGLALCGGLSAGHAAGVVHRDLKPDNVLLGGIAADGGLERVAISDFGIASSPGALGGIAGTPAYMAPEQVVGGAIDPRTDLYAVGAVLFEVLTGHKAWPEAQDLAHARSRATRTPPDPRTVRATACPQLSAITLRCLAPAPADRYPDVASLRSALESAMVREEAAPKSLSRPSIRARAVLVLPFAAGAGPDAWLGRSAAAEAAELLARSVALSVRAAPPGREGEDPVALARALGVDAVLSGALTIEGDQVSLRATLVGAVDGYALVRQEWTFPRRALLGQIVELASRVANALTVEAGWRPSVLPPERLEPVLRARFLARSWVPADLAAARSILQAQVADHGADPVVSATLALVMARAASGVNAPDQFQAEARQAKAVAAEAVVRAPWAAEPHLASALVDLYGGEPGSAAVALTQAARLAPGNAQVQQLLGLLLLEVGAVDAARRHLDAAIEIEPEHSSARTDRARLAAYLGDWVGVAEHLRIRSQDWVQALGLVQAGWRFRMWSAEAPPVAELPAEGWAQAREKLAWFAEVTDLTRRVAERRVDDEHVRTTLEASFPTSPRLTTIRGQFRAEIAMALGWVDHARPHLESAVAAGLIDVLWMDRCPILAPLRAEPWFLAARDEVDARAGRVRAVLVG